MDTVLIEIASHAIVLDATPSPIVSPDPDDQHLWNLLGSHDDVILVTGDVLLHIPGPLQDRVLTPQAFVASWPA